MTIQHLSKYLARNRNIASQSVNNIDQARANEIFRGLDCDLSPENLHCDGEITSAQVERKFKLFIKAGEALIDLGFSPPTNSEYF